MVDKNSTFSAGVKPAWGSEAIKTIAAVPVGKRIIIAVVFVKSIALEPGEIAVTVGDCAGSIEVKPF
jgi:precorrin-6B methylase 2